MTLRKRQTKHEENSVDLGYSGMSVVVTGAASNICLLYTSDAADE